MRNNESYCSGLMHAISSSIVTTSSIRVLSSKEIILGGENLYESKLLTLCLESRKNYIHKFIQYLRGKAGLGPHGNKYIILLRTFKCRLLSAKANRKIWGHGTNFWGIPGIPRSPGSMSGWILGYSSGRFIHDMLTGNSVGSQVLGKFKTSAQK